MRQMIINVKNRIDSSDGKPNGDYEIVSLGGDTSALLCCIPTLTIGDILTAAQVCELQGAGVTVQIEPVQ